MNLILFEQEEISSQLPLSDPRAIHILNTLRRKEGDSFDAGVVNGPRARGIIREIASKALMIDFEIGDAPPPLHQLSLLVGLPRPQTARRILREATSLGVDEIHFAETEKGEPSYGDSKLWSTDECRRHLITGAEQAFTTRIPLLKRHQSLDQALDQTTAARTAIALDNYEATGNLRDHDPMGSACLIAVGPERGWSATERNTIRSRQIPLLQLGANVLRTETACLCAITIVLAKLKLI